MRVVKRWLVLGAVLLSATGVQAGNLDSPGAPTAPASAMYRIEDVYNRLDTGAAGSQQAFTDPASGPAPTMHTLNEVMAKAPLLDAVNGATAAQVLSGKTFWGLLSGGWGTLTGTMPNNGTVNITPTTSAQTIAAGYHNGSGSVAGDADLVAGNIQNGVDIFGVTGTVYPAPVAKTGAGDLPSYTEVAGEDGHAAMRRGVAWPNPRFTDNGNGTMKDNLAGLIWLKDANPFGATSWNFALMACATLNTGEEGLSDGSVEGDWRLPNVQELQSLISYGYANPAFTDRFGTSKWASGDAFGFSNVQVSSGYWSSTTYADSLFLAWLVGLNSGQVAFTDKGQIYIVWPVRGP